MVVVDKSEDFLDAHGLASTLIYFIPEGLGQTYAKAAFAELKLEPDGTPLMVALCDGDLNRIAIQARRKTLK